MKIPSENDLILFHMGRRRGGGDSALPRVVFFTNSVRDATKFGDFSYNLVENRIISIKMTRFYPESRSMTIFVKYL